MGRRRLALLAAVVIAAVFVLKMTRGESPRWDVYGGFLAVALVIAAVPSRPQGGG